MANQIRVTPDELTKAASIVESCADTYMSIYNGINSDVENLASTWQGEANQQYVNQLNGFRNDFENLYNLMNKYATYLRSAATKYQTAEDNIKQAANQLEIGI